MTPVCRCGKRRLARSAGVSEETLQLLAEVVCAWHDLGKLRRGWQEAMWNWQREREDRTGAPPAPQVAIAHSDFDPGTDRETQNQPQFRRPSHAMAGACAASMALNELLLRVVGRNETAQRLWRAMVWAIARHHRPRTSAVPEFELVSDALLEMKKVLPQIEGDVSLPSSPEVIRIRECLEKEPLLFASSGDRTWPAYCFVVRWLRLADQQSMASLTA